MINRYKKSLILLMLIIAPALIASCAKSGSSPVSPDEHNQIINPPPTTPPGGFRTPDAQQQDDESSKIIEFGSFRCPPGDPDNYHSRKAIHIELGTNISCSFSLPSNELIGQLILESRLSGETLENIFVDVSVDNTRLLPSGSIVFSDSGNPVAVDAGPSSQPVPLPIRYISNPMAVDATASVISLERISAIQAGEVSSLRLDIITGSTIFGVANITITILDELDVVLGSISYPILVAHLDDEDADGVLKRYDALPNDRSRSVDGKGSAATPYIISNIYQLQAIAGVDHEGTALSESPYTNNRFLYGESFSDQLVKHYILANDINASATKNADSNAWSSSGWQPIGFCGSDANLCDMPFNGSFSGDGFIIDDLTIIANDSVKGVGLFAGLGSTANLSDVHLRKVSINGSGSGSVDNIGMLVGYAKGVVGFTSTIRPRISSSSAQGMINLPANAGGGISVGGLLGKGDELILDNSYVEDSRITGVKQIGGLAGFISRTNITSSYTKGLDIRGSEFGVGGLVGSVSKGNIRFSYAKDVNVSAPVIVGGLIGAAGGDESQIIDSYASGGIVDVRYDGGTGGGLSANSISIKRSYMAVKLRNSGGSDSTNLAGLSNIAFPHTITDSYWDRTINVFLPRDNGASTTALLQGPITSDTYVDWETIFCDENTGEQVSADAEDAVDAWDFGANNDYPVLTCTPGGVETQR